MTKRLQLLAYGSAGPFHTSVSSIANLELICRIRYSGK